MPANTDPHALGQCWCGQYHLTSTWAPGVVGITPYLTTSVPTTSSYTISTWPPAEPEPTTAYEGRHRSE